MFTKYSLVASLVVGSMLVTSSDVFAGGKRPGTRNSRPIFSSSRSCCVAVNPCAPATVAAPTAPATVAATDGTYRSFSVDPAAPAPVYRAPVYRAPAAVPSRTPSYLLPKSDPRRFNGSGW